MQGLKENGVFKTVCRGDIPRVANVLGGRFAHSIKNKDTKYDKYKARYIVQGHKDREKYKLVHTSTNLRQSSIRLITALTSVYDFEVWMQHVTQAYLQSADKLLRDIYIRPPTDLCLLEILLLKLQKPLYGLGESGDYWEVTMTRHLKNDIKIS